MTIAALVTERLEDYGAISALVGTRIYARKLPQHPTYPAITYLRVSNTLQDGTSNRRQSRWQINCWAEHALAAIQLADAVKAGFEEWYDESVTPGVAYALVVNETEDYDDDAKVYRNIVDVMLTTIGD